MKRLFSLFLAGILLCSLAACKGDPDDRPFGQEGMEQSVSSAANADASQSEAGRLPATKARESNEGLVISPMQKVVYPKKTSFDDFNKKLARRSANPVDESFLQAVNSFAGALAVQTLRGQAQNRNLSPVSLYMALSLAASGAQGETREELLSALGLSGKNTDYLVKQSNHLFQRLCFDNEIGRLRLANSIWLNQNETFKDAFVDQAAEKFYASAYQVDFSRPKTAKAMSKWISEQTNGVLQPEITFPPRQLMTILNTVYFKDEWSDRFDRQATKQDSFYVSGSQTVQCDFMNTTYPIHSFTRGKGYTRSALSLKNGGRMVFVLPDENVSIDSLLSSSQAAAALFTGEDSGAGKVVFQVPKFSFGSQLELADTMKKMGITRAFSREQADFSGMTQSMAFFSGVRQETHIAIDEKGVEAAAFTKLDLAGAAAPIDQVAYMILNRPFLYGIISDGVLVFAGICRNPAEK